MAALATVIALSVGANATHRGEHLLTDRDPGVYVTTGRWLAGEGSFLVQPVAGPFADVASLRYEQPGWSRRDDGRLEPQFLHLLPALLALGHLAGGDEAMLLVPPVLGGVALAAVAAFAGRFLRPWPTVAATALLALTLPQVWASRDAYSELVAQALLFGGLAVLVDARRSRSVRRALVAGLLLGAVTMARVEGLLNLLPLSLALLVDWASRPHAERPAARPWFVAVAAGIAVTALVGVADLVLVSPNYVRFIRASVVPALVGTAALWVVVAVVAVAAVAVAGVALRPLVQTVTGAPNPFIGELQALNDLPVDPTRRYTEHSFRWFGWYLGPLAVLGVVGLSAVVRRCVSDLRAHAEAVPFLLVFLVTSLLYLWRPSIVPDHVWVMRRFLPVTLPGLVVLACWWADRLWGRAPGLDRRLLAGAGLASGAVFLVATLAPVPDVREQREVLATVEAVCERLPERAAVVVLEGVDVEELWPQTIRAWCDVPVAIAPAEIGPVVVGQLAAEWAAEGVELFVLAGGPGLAEDTAGAEPVTFTAANDRPLEQTLTRRPSDLGPHPFVVHLAPVPAP